MKHDDALPALTDDEIIDMVRDADLDWHAGYPVGEDEANRYATLARAVEQRVRTALAAREGEPVGEIVELGSRAEPKSDALGSANRAKVDAEQGWRRECDDTDAVLRLIGLDPEQCRTDGGSLNVPKIGSLLRDRATALAYLCPAGCGCTWRDNGDGSMSLYGPSSRSCAACETMPLSKLLPVYTAPAQPASAEQQHAAWEHRIVEPDGTEDHVLAYTREYHGTIGRSVEAVQLYYAAPPAPSAEPVPDAAWEALQRLIENAGAAGPASTEDALLVARYRRRLLAAPPETTALLREALAALVRGRPQIRGVLVQQDQDAAINALRAHLGDPAP